MDESRPAQQNGLNEPIEPKEPKEQKEIVLTYRQDRQIEPVQLRYERDLPPCMLRRENPRPARAAEQEDEDYLAPWRRAMKPEPHENLKKAEKNRRKRRLLRLLAGVCLLTTLVFIGLGIWYVREYGWALPGDSRSQPYNGGDWDGGYYWEHGGSGRATTIRRSPAGGEARLLLAASEELPVLEPGEVYAKVNPSVVTVLGSQSGYRSVGTGVIFSEDGYILTNYHVISGCGSCEVWVPGTGGGEVKYEAKLVGFDEDEDLAVLKINGLGLPVAEFGISDDLKIGDTCYAIGNPLGLDLRHTFTNGIVSAVNRSMDVDGINMTLIQTNAALNSGNSGGPLINQYGQVVGINTIKMMSEYDTIEGLGFAIPTSLAERWVNELVAYGELLPKPVLGITISTVGKMFHDGTQGTLCVVGVQAGKSGDLAGIEEGDYVVAFNGQEVSTTDEILAIRRELFVGDEVDIRVYRDGEYLDLVMTMTAE